MACFNKDLGLMFSKLYYTETEKISRVGFYLFVFP